MIRKSIIVFIILLVAAISFTIYIYIKPRQSLVDEIASFTLDAESLASEYENDENKSNLKYLGKVIEVQGIISEKLSNNKGEFIVVLEGKDLSGVSCSFDFKESTKVATVQVGHEVKIKGICTGSLIDVVLVDCVLLIHDISKQ